MIYLTLVVVKSDYMDTNSPVYNELNKAWKVTCKVLFGEEIGELKEYEEWLKEVLPEFGRRKSYISGKETTFTLNEYCDDARFVSMDEIKEKAIDPLTINEIKDIDSIIEAISNKWEYTGNKVLGNSTFVESSDAVRDSHYVRESIAVNRSSHQFAVTYANDSRYCFGCARYLTSEFVIRCLRFNANRAFNSYWIVKSNDVYNSTNLIGCNEMLFCFNQRGKNRCIGNLELPSDKYFALKKKLLDEIKEELKKNKRFPSIFELIPNISPTPKAIREIDKAVSTQEIDMVAIEKTFSSAFKVLFRKETGDMMRYKDWLLRNVARYSFDEIDSAFGSKTFMFSPEYFKMWRHFPKRRTVSHSEAVKLSSLHLEESDLNSLSRIKDKLGEIAYLTEEGEGGRNLNVAKVLYAEDCVNMYWSLGKHNEGVAFCPESLEIKYVFGSNEITYSQFCMKCNNSTKLTRCFELDSCENCSDTYFAHNCEGLQDAMFCWNTKGKRYAIGNAQLPPDQYRKIKEILIEQMADEIIKTKQLRYDIYNIGCSKK